MIEFAGPVIEQLSMEGRMTICNMTIERRPRRHDRPRRDHVRVPEGPPGAPQGEAWDEAVEAWKQLKTDEGATFDEEVTVDVDAISPMITWGTTPGQVVGVAGTVPEPTSDQDRRALQYMALEPGTPMEEIKLDRVFIGSCTNSRIGDLRVAAEVVKGKKVADGVIAMVVPGSAQVKAQAEEEGLDRSSPRPALTGAAPAARCASA